MSNFDEVLGKKASEVKTTTKQYLIMDDVNNEDKFKQVNAEIRNDAKGNECAYIDYQRESDAKQIRQKYTRTQYQELVFRRNAVGVDKITTEYLPYEKRLAGRTQFDRLFPVLPLEHKPKTERKSK